MKLFKTILAVALASGASLAAMAQGGYQDGIDYYNADRFDKAKIILEKTLEQPNTNKGMAYYYLGCIALRNSDKAAAKANFEKGLAANPECGFNEVGLAELDLMAGDKKAGESRIKSIEKEAKKNADLASAIARAYFNADKVAYAKEIDKYLAMAMKSSKNKAASAYVLQGDMAAAAGDVNNAAAFYNQAMVYEEEAGNVNPEAYVKYANLYNRVNHDFSLDKLNELRTKTNGQSALALNELAEKYYDAEQYGKAAEVYREYMSNPNHFQQDEQRFSQLLYFGKDYDQSLQYAKKVLAQDPDNYYMYRMVMLNDNELKNYDEAAQYGQKLFSTPGAQLTSMDYNTYANVLTNLGRPQEAIAIYEQGYNANPEKNAEMLTSIAGLYIDAKDLAKAIEYQEKFVASPKSKLNDKIDLARYYTAYGQTLPEGSPERAEAANKGLAIIDQALESVSESSRGPVLNYRTRLLTVRDGSEPTAELIDTYDKMIEAYGGDAAKNPQAFKLAYVYKIIFDSKNGNKESARAAYDLLQALDPEFPNLESLEKMTH